MSSYPSRPVAAVKTAQTAASATSAAVTTTSKFLAVKRWVQDHPVMAVAALLAVGTGVTYYVQTTQASRGPSKGGRKAGGKPGKKAAKSDKSSSSPESASPSISTSQESLSNETDESALFPEDITALNETERKLLANRAKQHGNTYYARGDLKDAIRLYTQAIALHADPMFYSNRAACYLRTKQWLEVIADTSAALELAPRYVKAISRRAQAFEAMGMWNEALKDWTSLAVLEGFKVQSTLEASDRVIHQLAEARATELTQSRAKKLPSGAFVTAYMQAFHAHSPEALAIHLSLVPKTEGDAVLRRVLQLLKDTKWLEAFGLLDEALAKPLSPTQNNVAMILQGTREFLMGDPRAAISFFTKVLAKDKSNTEAMIKLGSCYMELGDSEEAINRFNMAEAANKHNPDIYYHRAQVRFLLEDLDKALTDYQRAIELNPDFLFSYIQMAVTLYKSKKHDEAEALFKKTLDQFPDRFETWNYYGEILMDQQRLDEAEAAFKRSLELDTEKRSPLALINQAILASQVRKDLAAAEALCQEALQRDAECEVAYNQLAQVYLQQQRFPEAIRCYDQVIDIVRNPVELLGMISCREAAAVQYYVMEKFPEDMRKLQASIGGA